MSPECVELGLLLCGDLIVEQSLPFGGGCSEICPDGGLIVLADRGSAWPGFRLGL
jgi:hypothetical protein